MLQNSADSKTFSEPVHLLHESVCSTDRILNRTEFVSENLTDFQTDFEPKKCANYEKIQLKIGQNMQVLANIDQLWTNLTQKV